MNDAWQKYTEQVKAGQFYYYFGKVVESDKTIQALVALVIQQDIYQHDTSETMALKIFKDRDKLKEILNANYS